MNSTRQRLVMLIFLSVTSSWAKAEVRLTLSHFFGECEEPASSIQAARGEPCIINSIIDAYSNQSNGVSIETLSLEFGSYYDQLRTRYARRRAPDLFVLHKHRIAEFASIRVLLPLPEEDLEMQGIETSDWVSSAKEAVTVDGQIVAVPLDFQALLWHLNVDLFKKAGLVTDDGVPVLPSSPQELVDQARKIKNTTGKSYLSASYTEFQVGVRIFLTLLWQQGSDIIVDGKSAVNTPEARRAARTVLSLYESGYTDLTTDYASSESRFLEGDSAVLINGTWAVDSYASEARSNTSGLLNYKVTDFPAIFPQEASWSDAHLWALPHTMARSPEKYKAALDFLSWLNDHHADWARTGHLAVRQSVFKSDIYKQLPHRESYVDTVNRVRQPPPSVRYSAIQEVLDRELISIWSSKKSVEQGLADAQKAISRLL